MSDLISRQAAIDEINHELRCGAVIDQCGLETAHDLIEALPSAQPRQGRWIDDCSCSNCHWIHEDDKGFALLTNYNFCPNCGADMRGEADE